MPFGTGFCFFNGWGRLVNQAGFDARACRKAPDKLTRLDKELPREALLTNLTGKTVEWAATASYAAFFEPVQNFFGAQTGRS
ncbi:hypothetical protein GCM10009077_06790 [Roseibium denhamense]